MAYAVKYILQFTSDRGNEIRIEVLKKDYQGEVIYKCMGGAPSLSIEQGDGAIKGSSLVFAMQADVEGELQELYTTDNKQFKVNMYRNEVLSWQGYILPELYSEEYVDAPYDVSVTATDQLATLKAITYLREDVNVSLSTIIEDILSFTQISVPVTYHQNLSALRKGEVPMLVDSHISQAAYNGYSCYDVLNNILLSCNCCIMQINGEWLITSLTNSTTNYYTAGVTQVREHKALGQLGVGEVCPAGTLTLVNNPALKGARVEYAHMLRHSFLANADCVDREGWNYTPDSRNPIDIPGEREAFGKIFKTYCWELHPVNIREDNSLQLWQEVALEKDEGNYYDLSVKTLFSTNAKLLLMAVTYLGSDGIERRLTAEGWVEKWDKSDVNYYIQITGNEKSAGLDAIADIEQYEVSTVQFALPPVDGTMRIGFINSTTDYTDPLGSAPIYVSQVYLTVSGVTGQECTTEVEPNATQEQQDVLLAYGDTFESENAYKLGLNTLKKSSGENITSWWLDNVNYSSYYDTMLQEFSRYFGVKKVQLQGIIMGKDVLSDMYADVFSGRVMRLLSAQVDLLADEASVTVEEVITTTVNFNTVIYATNNTNSFGSSSGGGSGTSGGSSSTAGESLLGVQSDGDVYVKDGRALVGQEGRFENLALPVDAPTERKERRTYLYSSDPSKGAIDIAKIAKWIDEQEEMWVLDAENRVIKTTYNVVSEQEIISGRRASGSGSGGGGGISEITAQMVVDALGYVPYSSLNPAGYITSAAIPTALKNPFALTINGHTYDGSEAVNITISGGGGVADSVDWANVYNKPTTLGGYGITDAISTSGGVITGKGYDILTINRTDNRPTLAFAYNGTPVGYLGMTTGGVPMYVSSAGDAYSLYHSGNFNPADYLPKSGGTISGDYNALKVKRNNNYGAFIQYENNQGVLGVLGIDTDGTPILFRGSQLNNADTILHSGNYSSYALPLSGGTIVSDNYMPLILNTTNAQCRIQFRINATDKAIVGWNDVYGSWLYNYPSGCFIGVKDDGTPHYNGNTLIHSNNIGLYNAGSATKLQDNTAFTAWGQTFFENGKPKSVSGYITGVSSIRWDGNYGVWSGDSWTGALTSQDVAIIAKKAYFNGNVLIGTTADKGYKLDVYGSGRFISAQSATSSITKSNQSLVITGSGAGYVGYSVGLSFNGIGNYEANYIDHSHAWIGLGKNTTTSGPECYPLVFAVNGSTTLNASPTERMRIMPNGNVLIDTISDNGSKLQVVGDITATGEVISSRRASSSDARLKDDINRLIAEDCLAMVRNLQPSSWNWKENGEHSMGFIAQDIEPLMPYAVTKIKDDVLGQRLNLQYDQFIALAIGGVQAVDNEVQQLKKEVAKLKRRLSKYETVWQ